MTVVVISQSNYIPWRGYFDLIQRCDHFVFYDCVQFTRRDWRNRNRIVTRSGPVWLTVPVVSKGRYAQTVDETRISDSEWAQQHLKTLRHTYGKTRLFEAHGPLVQKLYEDVEGWPMLSKINRHFTEAIASLLGLDAEFHDSRDFVVREERSRRLLDICKALGATRYLSGPSARDYLQTEVFAEEGIEVEWMDYPAYPSYLQLDGNYAEGVSILDALAHLAPSEIFG